MIIDYFARSCKVYVFDLADHCRRILLTSCFRTYHKGRLVPIIDVKNLLEVRCYHLLKVAANVASA